MSESAVPVVDIAPFLSGDEARKAAVAQAVDAACRRIGFLIVAGHGVPRPVIDDALAATWAFFDQGDAEKRQWMSPKGDFRRGYMPVGGNALAYTLGGESPPDLIEAFTFGRFDLPEEPYYAAHRETWFEPNIWPSRPDRLSARALLPTLCAYYRAMERLAETLMRIFALALGMPEKFFADKIDRHITAMRLNHYAEATRPPLPGQLRRARTAITAASRSFWRRQAPAACRCAAATGRGAMSSLCPIPSSSTSATSWRSGPTTAGSRRCTAWPIRAPDRRAGSRRASIAFFHQPNHDALIECLPTCRRPDDPPRYAPTTSGAHLLAKTAKETGTVGSE